VNASWLLSLADAQANIEVWHTCGLQAAKTMSQES
jgi:hypothetical protein